MERGRFGVLIDSLRGIARTAKKLATRLVSTGRSKNERGLAELPSNPLSKSWWSSLRRIPNHSPVNRDLGSVSPTRPLPLIRIFSLRGECRSGFFSPQITQSAKVTGYEFFRPFKRVSASLRPASAMRDDRGNFDSASGCRNIIAVNVKDRHIG